jgi:hypothetical protein
MVLVLKIFFQKKRSQSYDPKNGKKKRGPIKRFLTRLFSDNPFFWRTNPAKTWGKTLRSAPFFYHLFRSRNSYLNVFSLLRKKRENGINSINVSTEQSEFLNKYEQRIWPSIRFD